MFDLLNDYYDKRLKEVNVKYVKHSVFEFDNKGMLINNIDNIVINDTIKFYTEYKTAKGKTIIYESKYIKNPTWLDIAILANDMIKLTGNKHHIFLEGIVKNKKFLFKKYYNFIMGS